MTFRSTMPLALGLLIAACAPEAEQMAEGTTQEYASPAEAAAMITALAADYEEKYNAGDAEAVAALYTSDAIVIGSDAEVHRGPAAIAASIAEFTTAFSPELTIMPEEQLMIGDWVVDRGSYQNTLTPAGGEETTLSGYYMSVSRVTGDGLKLHRVGVNFDAPPPMPMPAPEMVKPEPVVDGPMAKMIAAYTKHYNAGHAKETAELYTKDAVAMWAEQEAKIGRPAIEARIAEVMAETTPAVAIMDAESKMIGDGWAFDRGSFTVKGTMEGQKTDRTGQYLILTRQMDDGSWKIHWGISTFEPMAAM